MWTLGWVVSNKWEGRRKYSTSKLRKAIGNYSGQRGLEPSPDFMKIYEFFAIDTQAKIASVVLDSVLDLRATPGGISLVLGVRGPASAQ